MHPLPAVTGYNDPTIPGDWRLKLPWPAVVIAAWVTLGVVNCYPVLAEEAACTNPSLSAAMDQTCPVQAIATAVDHHYNALKSLKVQFSQRYTGMGMTREESGMLLLKKPGRMRWTYSKPAGKLFVLDGRFAYFYAPGDSQIQRVPAKQLDDLRSPLRFLLGHTQLGKEIVGLTAVHIGPNGVAGIGTVNSHNDVYLLAGVPRGLEKRVERISLLVTRDGVIHRMNIEELDGAETVFSLEGEQTNPVAPDSEFVFQAPRGVPVVEGMPPV